MYEEPFKLLVQEPGMAMELIMQRHGSQLRKRIELFIRDDEEMVKDVISDTSIAIWTSREKVARLDDPFAWMMVVAKYLALNRIRRERRHLKVSLDYVEYLTDSIQADTALDYKELHDQFMQAVENLTPKERDVLIDAKIHGMNNRELGIIHGVTVQRAKNILSSGMKKLRRYFRDI